MFVNKKELDKLREDFERKISELKRVTIDRVESTTRAANENVFSNKEALEKFSRKLIHELFTNKEDMEDVCSGKGSWHPYVRKTVAGELRKTIVAAVIDELGGKIKAEIAGEEFIDSVVERIHKKQLNK